MECIQGNVGLAVWEIAVMGPTPYKNSEIVYLSSGVFVLMSRLPVRVYVHLKMEHPLGGPQRIGVCRAA